MSENSEDNRANEGKKRTLKESNGDEGRKINGGDQSDDHELHIWTERGRRKKMRNMFEDLHSLLPHLPSKTDKSSIVDEAVTRIKKLELILKTLQNQKLDPSKTAIQSREGFLSDHQGSTGDTVSNPTHVPSFFKTWTSPNVILNVCGNDAQISICSTWKPCLLTKICFVAEKNQLEVLSAHASSNTYQSMYMIHARANGGSEEAYKVEEKCKQAAAEIMLWVDS